MPAYERTTAINYQTMTFPQTRLDWRSALAAITVPNPDAVQVFILDETEDYQDERRQALEAAKTLGITIKCGQNRSQTPPLDRQFYVVRTA